MKPGTPDHAIPAKEWVSAQAPDIAGYANDVEAVTQ